MSADKFNVNFSFSRNWELLESKYVGTGHPDLTKYEWATNHHRDSIASHTGHADLLSYFAVAENESIGRMRFKLYEVCCRHRNRRVPSARRRSYVVAAAPQDAPAQLAYAERCSYSIILRTHPPPLMCAFRKCSSPAVRRRRRTTTTTSEASQRRAVGSVARVDARARPLQREAAGDRRAAADANEIAACGGSARARALRIVHSIETDTRFTMRGARGAARAPPPCAPPRARVTDRGGASRASAARRGERVEGGGSATRTVSGARKGAGQRTRDANGRPLRHARMDAPLHVGPPSRRGVE